MSSTTPGVYVPIGFDSQEIEAIKDASFEWANKSHKYLRKLSDWISLCSSCHKQYDYSFKRKNF